MEQQAEDEEVQQRDLFMQLGLAVSLHPAERKELKRVAELISRTNQFNMSGSRVTLKQVTAWHESSEHAIIVV